MNQLAGLSDSHIQTIEKSRQRVIESIGKNMDLYGITLSIGHLYGKLYFQNHPVTLDDMGQMMGMSKTSMSTGMRTLTDLKMVHKVWERGSRKDLYEVEPDWYQTFCDFFSIKWRKSIEQNVNTLKRSLTEMVQLQQAEATNEALREILDADIQKIQEALGYYRWLGRLIDSFETGQIFEFIPRDEPTLNP